MLINRVRTTSGFKSVKKVITFSSHSRFGKKKKTEIKTNTGVCTYIYKLL